MSTVQNLNWLSEHLPSIYHWTVHDQGQTPSFRRAVWLMTLTSFLIPAAGVITAPVLARGLSTQGRGELAAALAPSALMLAAATLGLPDALTYYLAKYPRLTRSAIVRASAVTTLLCSICIAVIYSILPFLSGGSEELGQLTFIAAIMTAPALIFGVFRGAAIGRQMWRHVAIERLINVTIRVVGFPALWVTGHLTVVSAVWLNMIGPLVSGGIYLGLLKRPSRAPGPPAPQEAAVNIGEATVLVAPRGFREIARFGLRVWFGGVASMLLSRSASTLMVPLAGESALGIYSVSSTIADLPLVVALAIQGTLFGVNSKATSAEQVTSTSRLTLLFGVTGCLALGVTLPLWISALFGEEFKAATLPTIILMASAVVCIPGLMASTGIAAWGRPGLRSTGLTVALIVQVVAFFALVPRFGVYGACWTSVLGNLVLTGFMLAMASRVMKISPGSFIRLSSVDFQRARGETIRAYNSIKSTVTPIAARGDGGDQSSKQHLANGGRS